ncbi:MAG: dihydropteroate synthase [Deltaproteobacteria bacterium]|nr:dihydropteroate synthase [Deltaproteobacteria bacterium]
MERIGVDPAGIEIMAPKQFHYNFKVEGLSAAQANVVKQDMLSIGGEAAVARGAASCTIKTTDAIISGTLKQFNSLIQKLQYQSFGLPKVARSLSEALENTVKSRFSIKTAGREWIIGERTLVMGVLNVTPDSFSDGGLFLDRDKAVERALEMVEQGSDWIDIGGESSRPGAEPVSAEEEIRRVVPVIELIAKKGVTVSIDTTKSKVARAALDAGAEIVNDISAMSMDSDMASVCAESKCPVILMHMRGTPKTMQSNIKYNDLISEVYGYLLSRIEYAESSGIEANNIIIDPGLGFGKSREGNFEIIKSLSEFKSLGKPILIGASRKSFIGKTLGADLDARVTGTVAASVIAIQNGAGIIRVHDVVEARLSADMADAIRRSGL